MMKGDLRALDRVVRIVRELDRYAGFRPGKRPEIPSQATEKIGFTPGLALAEDDEAAWSEDSRAPDFAPMGAPDQGPPPLGALLVAALDIRPETASQATENIDSAPGFSDAEASGDLAAASSAPNRVTDSEQGPPPLDARPEIPAQAIEKVDSAPGISQAEASADVTEPSSRLTPACMSQPEPGPPPLVTPLDTRPEIPAQHLEKTDFTPGVSAWAAWVGFVRL